MPIFAALENSNIDGIFRTAYKRRRQNFPGNTVIPAAPMCSALSNKKRLHAQLECDGS